MNLPFDLGGGEGREMSEERKRREKILAKRKEGRKGGKEGGKEGGREGGRRTIEKAYHRC